MTGHIHTSNETMYFNAKGEIGRTENDHTVIPSPSWKILGAVRINNFGREVEKIPFSSLNTLNDKWLYKNGKQRWHILDLDHGTKRLWQCPKHYVVSH